jgi:hypothetical protein
VGSFATLFAFFFIQWIPYIHTSSVPDPDPHVFGPPGSGSTSQRYGSGSGSFYHHAKIVRKTLKTLARGKGVSYIVDLLVQK